MQAASWTDAGGVHGGARHFRFSDHGGALRLTPAQYLASLGAFDVPVTAAHCVWLEDEDFDILKKHNVSVACCPASNLKLASGYANIPKMLEKGINIALGTDGAYRRVDGEWEAVVPAVPELPADAI